MSNEARQYASKYKKNIKALIFHTKLVLIISHIILRLPKSFFT